MAVRPWWTDGTAEVYAYQVDWAGGVVGDPTGPEGASFVLSLPAEAGSYQQWDDESTVNEDPLSNPTVTAGRYVLLCFGEDEYVPGLPAGMTFYDIVSVTAKTKLRKVGIKARAADTVLLHFSHPATPEMAVEGEVLKWAGLTDCPQFQAYVDIGSGDGILLDLSWAGAGTTAIPSAGEIDFSELEDEDSVDWGNGFSLVRTDHLDSPTISGVDLGDFKWFDMDWDSAAGSDELGDDVDAIPDAVDWNAVLRRGDLTPRQVKTLRANDPGDLTMRILLRGGFTRHQAQLILEEV